MTTQTIFATLFIAALAINTPAVAQNKETLEKEATICLEYLKPRLNDPRSAYVGNIRKEGTVLKMDLYTKNQYGAHSPAPVACEIKNGRLDEGWTKIHLERLNWR